MYRGLIRTAGVLCMAATACMPWAAQENLEP